MCNYDGEALGVQFFGIGDAVGAAEAYFRAAKPSIVMALIDRLERAESAFAASLVEQPAAAPEAAPIYQAKVLVDPKWTEVSKQEFDRAAQFPNSIDRRIVYAATQPPAQASWRELCRRLYVELFHCDQQIRNACRRS
ncbi:hypothetical protein [Burkholderia sp. PU8-34]